MKNLKNTLVFLCVFACIVIDAYIPIIVKAAIPNLPTLATTFSIALIVLNILVFMLFVLLLTKSKNG